jgi:hypothetical protein
MTASISFLRAAFKMTFSVETALKTEVEELERLGLSKPIPQPEKKRGRPRKNPKANDKPKRPRGCPRKNPLLAGQL